MTHQEPRRAARILVVEDERHVARFIEFVLKKAGYEVFVAHDGEEALQQVERCSPDAVLLDLVMPKLSGEEVLRRLRADSRYKKLIIAVLTARSFERQFEETTVVGSSFQCEKPVAPSTLLKQLLVFGIPPKVEDIPAFSLIPEVASDRTMPRISANY